ncbi:unnamed protein product, partial [Amoebophrya sp. A25]
KAPYYDGLTFYFVKLSVFSIASSPFAYLLLFNIFYRNKGAVRSKIDHGHFLKNAKKSKSRKRGSDSE